jgi:hypothetical protein
MPVAESHQSSKSGSTASDGEHHQRVDRAGARHAYAWQSDRKVIIARYVFVTMLSMIATLGCLEALARVVVSLGKPINFSTNIFDAKYYEAVCPRNTAVPRLFFLGTSHVGNGVYGELISRRLEQSGYRVEVSNLGCPWGFPTDELFLLREAIAHGAKPAAVIFEIEHSGFVSPYCAAHYSEEFRKSYMGYLVAERKSPIDKLKYRLDKYSFLFRYRAYFYQTLVSLRNTLLGYEWMNTSSDGVHRETSVQGWVPLYSLLSPERLKSSLAKREKQHMDYFQNALPIDKNIRNYNVQPVYEFCKSNHIPLILLRMPVHPQFEQLFCRTLRVSPEHFEDVFRKQAAIYHAPVLDFSGDKDDDHFSDCDHLSALGAITTSERIARALSEKPYSDLLQRYRTK